MKSSSFSDDFAEKDLSSLCKKLADELTGSHDLTVECRAADSVSKYPGVEVSVDVSSKKTVFTFVTLLPPSKNENKICTPSPIKSSLAVNLTKAVVRDNPVILQSVATYIRMSLPVLGSLDKGDGGDVSRAMAESLSGLQAALKKLGVKTPKVERLTAMQLRFDSSFCIWRPHILGQLNFAEHRLERATALPPNSWGELYFRADEGYAESVLADINETSSALSKKVIAEKKQSADAAKKNADLAKSEADLVIAKKEADREARDIVKNRLFASFRFGRYASAEDKISQTHLLGADVSYMLNSFLAVDASLTVVPGVTDSIGQRFENSSYNFGFAYQKFPSGFFSQIGVGTHVGLWALDARLLPPTEDGEEVDPATVSIDSLNLKSVNAGVDGYLQMRFQYLYLDTHASYQMGVVTIKGDKSRGLGRTHVSSRALPRFSDTWLPFAFFDFDQAS